MTRGVLSTQTPISKKLFRENLEQKNFIYRLKYYPSILGNNTRGKVCWLFMKKLKKVRRLTSLLTAFLLLAGSFAAVQAEETILDRAQIPLAETEAEGLYKLGLLKGTEDGLELEREVTRAEAVVMVSRVCGLVFTDIGFPEPAFADIQGHWAQDIIEKFYHVGYIDGVSDTAFEPERTVTGKEFAKMLLSAIGYEVNDLEQVYELGKETGLLADNFTKSVVFNDEILLRSDTARLCFSALAATRADGKMLYKALIENGMYQEIDFEGILYSGTPIPSETTLADKLYNTMMPQDQNYIFSPLSIKMALALAANGANGDTKAEILSAMGIEDLTAFNNQARTLIDVYAQTDVVKLEIANSIWRNVSNSGGMQFSDTYKKSIADFYRGEAFDVTNETAVDEINNWVNEKTHGKITSLVDNSDFWTYLANAVYFKGSWHSPFSEHATEKATFTDRNGAESQIDFMNKTGYYNYFENDGMQIIELPYSNREERFSESGEYQGADVYEDLSVSTFLLLPKEGRITDAEQILKTTPLQPAFVDLFMPKFKTEFSVSLMDIFAELGMKTSLDKDTADFTAMYDEGNMWISDGIHKAYISVDEQGTEAAAATGFAGGTSAPPQPVLFQADHPFTYIIRDNNSGESLFMGEYAFAE